MEDEIILTEVQRQGFKWTQIASMLNKRTDDAVRNRWHRLSKKQNSLPAIPVGYTQTHHHLPNSIPMQ